jgi:hypothetical protein
MLNRKTRSLIVEQLRDLAEGFRKYDPKNAKAIRLIAADADAADLDAAKKHFRQTDIHVQAAILDLCPVSFDWIRFGIAWQESQTTFRPEEIRIAKKFLRLHRGDRHVAYNAALQKLIRTKREMYATIAAWLRKGER